MENQFEITVYIVGFIKSTCKIIPRPSFKTDMTQRRKWVWTCMINETIDYFMTKTHP